MTRSLNSDVIGQHIAVSHARWAVKGHLDESEPQHALSIIFLGSTGTGKNFVSNVIASALFGQSREYVHYFSGRLDFPLESKVQIYREKLQREISESVKKCERSIFIFDEIDKMPGGVIDGVKPFLDYHPSIRNVDYRKAIFLFLTNVGGLEINTLYLKLREKGITRESMRYSHFEKTLRHTLFNSGGMFEESVVIADNLISMFVPFLPLEKHHVRMCIMKEMSRRRITPTEENIKSVMDKMEFFEDEWSMAGCKRVSDHVSVERYTSSVHSVGRGEF